MIEFGELGKGQESYGLYILNGRGELQRRVLDFRDRKAAMAGAWTLLQKWTGCVALVVQMREGSWTACHVYTLQQCERFAALSGQRRRTRPMSMDVHSLPPSPAYAACGPAKGMAGV
jgi:hypothetical protein